MIVLVAPENEPVLRDEFARYARDYDIRCTGSGAETSALLRTARSGGHPVALLVTESQLPDTQVVAAFPEWRSIVPTCRRVVAAHWSRFMLDADPLRPGLATGKYDAYLLMPRGVRDEEFHTAITELLSDWGSTAPVVPPAHLVSAGLDPLTVALRDFAYQMGMPAQVVSPDSPTG